MYYDTKDHISEDFLKADEIKTGETSTEVIEPIRKRWSIRAFSDEMIANDTLETLFEAASWSPSSMNEQPWRYICAKKGSEEFDMIASTLAPSNKMWAEQAPVLVLSIAEKNFAANGRENHYALYDTGAANYGLLLQAQSMNIYGHIMGGFDRSEAARLLGLSDQQVPVVVIALGYPGSPDELPEQLKIREYTPRKRKPVSEIVKITG
ncbi:MAG: nitroreductase family protein [Ignavibacteriaceae bacterium]|nr:nitroreductase family protein [Ignavibacteriaceae bacterium]